jgi:hypothetical protein
VALVLDTAVCASILLTLQLRVDIATETLIQPLASPTMRFDNLTALLAVSNTLLAVSASPLGAKRRGELA